MFGVEPFEFDAMICLQIRLEDEPIDFPVRLAQIHYEVVYKGTASREASARCYDWSADGGESPNAPTSSGIPFCCFFHRVDRGPQEAASALAWTVPRVLTEDWQSNRQ